MALWFSGFVALVCRLEFGLAVSCCFDLMWVTII